VGTIFFLKRSSAGTIPFFKRGRGSRGKKV